MNKKYIPTLLILASLWGSDFMFIKIGVSSIHPSLFTSLRFLIAGITLFIFLKIKRYSFKIELKDILFIILIAIVDVYLPQILISLGERNIASGITSVILSSSPIFTFLLAHLLLKDEKINLYKLFFVILGFLGVFIIFYKELTNSNEFVLISFIFILLASITYGLGVILLKKLSTKIDTYLSCFYLVLFAFFISIPFVVFSKGITNSNFRISSILSLLFVGIVLQAFAYTFFLNAIRRFGASKTSYVGYLVPIFSIIYGSIFLKEVISINLFIGGFLIHLSAYFIERGS
jgi:drug/metabolite transporter (DMT)-like permease